MLELNRGEKMRTNRIEELFIIFKDKNNKTINNLLLISIIIAMSYIFTSSIPEVFRYGEQLYSLLNNISLAYIASYIFFAITVYSPNKKRKIKLHRYLFNNIVSLYNLQESLINTLLNYKEMDDSKIEALTKDRLKYMCRCINPNEKVCANIAFGNWHTTKCFENYFELLSYIHEETKNIIFKIMSFSEYLSDDVILLITSIEDNFDNHLNLSRGNVIENPDMQIYECSFWNLYKDYKKLLDTFNNDNEYISRAYNKMFMHKRKK